MDPLKKPADLDQHCSKRQKKNLVLQHMNRVWVSCMFAALFVYSHSTHSVGLLSFSVRDIYANVFANFICQMFSV